MKRVSDGRGAVVIPAYGKAELTLQIVEDCRREADVIDVVIIDNAGDLTDLPGIVTIRPRRNLGWLGGTNAGFAKAATSGYDWIVALNNDTRLSKNFFLGLREVLASQVRDLVAPCYDDVVETQAAYFRGPVCDFVPELREQIAPVIDGTCFALTTDLLHDLGPLDERNFGRRGWGAIEDYIMRVRALGGDSIVTHRSYLQHARGSTAYSVMTSYERYAASEMRRGLRRKYGPHWRANFGLVEGEPEGLRSRLGDAARAIEDRLGLSETAVGRR